MTRHGLDDLAIQPDPKDLFGGVDEQRNVAACTRLADGVMLIINIHAAICPHFPRKGLPVDRFQPAIWVDLFGERWQLW